MPARHDRDPADRCQAPEMPAPRIVDYRPHSTLVTPEHLVPKAKFPAIDFHGHPQDLIGVGRRAGTLIAAMDSLNLRVMVAADNMSGERLTRDAGRDQRIARMKDRVRVLTGIDFLERRTGLGGEGGRAARGRSSRRARSASARSARASACRRARPTARASSSTIPSSIRSGRRRAPQVAGLHPHRRSRRSSSSRSTTTNERWLELALFRRSPLSGRASSRASRS